MAKAANVQAAHELLQLATRHRPKLINYVSTLGVFAPTAAATRRVVDESSPITRERHVSSRGYVASKWVGEQVFMNAAARGVPCNIFRLGLVWADTRCGRYDELQRGYRILKSCLLSRYGIAGYQHEMPPTPVDYAARAMVLLGERHSEGSGIFHISAPFDRVPNVFERCNEILEQPLELLAYYDWICHQGSACTRIVAACRTAIRVRVRHERKRVL
jgi:thioester reductase-like protein